MTDARFRRQGDCSSLFNGQSKGDFFLSGNLGLPYNALHNRSSAPDGGDAMTQLATQPAPELPTDADGKWRREQRAFRQLLSELLRTHRGQYVAIHDGQVVESGNNKVGGRQPRLCTFWLRPDLCQPGDRSTSACHPHSVSPASLPGTVRMIRYLTISKFRRPHPLSMSRCDVPRPGRNWPTCRPNWIPLPTAP